MRGLLLMHARIAFLLFPIKVVAAGNFALVSAPNLNSPSAKLSRNNLRGADECVCDSQLTTGITNRRVYTFTDVFYLYAEKRFQYKGAHILIWKEL
jgi:hypothetical protein